METTLTRDQALDVIKVHGGYGAVRVYGIIADGPSAGQISAIKSVHHLETRQFSRIYATHTTMADLIRKA